MCGVFGYVGQQTDVGETILTALKTLEYRGYDSWGLALATSDDLLVHKDVGRINGHARILPDARPRALVTRGGQPTAASDRG